MPFKHNVSRGVLQAFVPNRLEIANMPDLNLFPFNVLFASYTVRDEKLFMGSAIYEPDLSSFKNEEGKYSMIYHNAYGGRGWLVIEYDLSKRSYFGEKFVNDKSVGKAVGMEWNMFFVHFTGLGLFDGEKSKIEPAD